MTMIAGAPPRVRIWAGSSITGLSASLENALAMLSEARRIVLVGPDERADIVHTVGPADLPDSPSGHRVHTVDRIPLRDGRLTPTGWWVRRERRRVREAVAWLAHGQTAGRLLVDAGLAPGERVHCLPLTSPGGCATVESDRAARSAVRERLRLAPGVRLVLGVEPSPTSRSADRWDRILVDTRRRDVLVARIRAAGVGIDDRYAVQLVGGLGVSEPLPLRELLAAADLYIAADHDVEAYTPAAAAVGCGIPVVAVTTDSVAELVMSGGRGCVVPARGACIAAGVMALLDNGMPPRRTPTVSSDQPHQQAELAHGLLAVYRHVLCTCVVGGAA